MLSWLREHLNDRKFAFRNRPRTNLTLGPMLLHSTGRDDERAYAHDLRTHLRTHLRAHAGIAPPRHQITDLAGQPSLWR